MARKYILTQKYGGVVFEAASIPLDNKRNYSIETEVVHLSGTDQFPMGLVFASKDRNDNYYFAISANGNFIFVQRQQGIYSQAIINWTFSDAIVPGANRPNKLRIEKRNDTLTFKINGQQVGQIFMVPPMGNQIGFYMENAQSVAFDYLTINYLDAPVKDTVKKTMDVPVNAVVNNPVNIPAKDTVKKTTDIPVNAIVNKPVDVPAKDTVKKTTDIPVNAIVNKPVDVPAKDTVKKTTDIPVNAIVNKPVEAPAKDTVKKTTDIPVNTIVNQPVDVPAKDTVKKTTDIPVNAIVNKPVDVPANDTVKKKRGYPGKHDNKQTFHRSAAGYEHFDCENALSF